jgi:uncharacterized membrane protein
VGHESFYSTAAQIIPVLWVVLVFQLRFFGREPKKGYFSLEADEMHRKTGTSLLVIICAVGFLLWVAEGTAIGCLASEEDTAFSRGLIRLALALGTLYVFIMPLQPWLEALLERTPLERVRQKLWKWMKVGEQGEKPPVK